LSNGDLTGGLPYVKIRVRDILVFWECSI
jgi:hypothetical protein